LVIVAQAMAALGGSWQADMPAAAGGGGRSHLARLIAYFGAGIYEELLFRLLLLVPAVALLRHMGMNRRGSVVSAVVLTSLIFAAAHYQFDFTLLGLHASSPHGEPFAWFSFLFRLAAGVSFAAIFATRGFGIAVGAHALYDLFVLVL
jgi:membrane protease YdiL (CAAX protease family)